MRPTAYRRNARGLRDRQAFEGVRMQAGALFAAGHSRAQVAHQLGVARQNVSRWHAQWQAGGLEGLRSAGPTGPAPCLSDAQLAAIGETVEVARGVEIQAAMFSHDATRLAHFVIDRRLGGRPSDRAALARSAVHALTRWRQWRRASS